MPERYQKGDFTLGGTTFTFSRSFSCWQERFSGIAGILPKE